MGSNVYVRLTDTRRDVIELDGAIAPEIEQRRLNLLWPSIKDSEYRAPHSKVREARNGGLSIAEMAKRFKVSERTINYRLADIPDTVPPVNRNALQVAAGGGYTRSKFWPGADFIPRGSTESRPRDKEIPFGVGWFPVQPGPSPERFAHNHDTPQARAAVRAKKRPDWIEWLCVQPGIHVMGSLRPMEWQRRKIRKIFEERNETQTAIR